MGSKPRQIALHPFLLAAYAVLFIYAANMRYALFSDVVVVTALAVAGSVLVFGLCWLVFRDVGRAALVAGAVVIAFFGYRYIVSVVSADPPAILLVLVAGLIVGLALVLVVGFPRLVPPVNTALSVVSAVLLVFALTTIIPNVTTKPAGSLANSSSGLTATRNTGRDIFYFVLDRYGSNEALRDGFGITDNDFPDWLEQQGFYVADNARSNYIRTLLSQPATLNLEYLDGLVADMGTQSSDYRPLVDAFQDHKVGLFLKEQGYRYIHMGNWFGPTANIAIADRNIRGSSWSEFDSTLFATTAASAASDLIAGHEQRRQLDQVSAQDALYQFDALKTLADDPSKDFVFAHILLPHDPYVFDADGNLVTAEQVQEMSRDDLFAGQLAYTNNQIKALVDDLLKGPDETDPIIVIQSDEGPYPEKYDENQFTFDWTTATDAEINTKYGVLDAFYLPEDQDEAQAEDGDTPELYETISTVNTWRVVFDRYFGTDLPLLPDRSYVSRTPDLPYDLIDITDRIVGTRPTDAATAAP
jgi:hypothetical protein